jgi:uncharacterized membrane protein YdjX (TVP38/TMEM64 family)
MVEYASKQRGETMEILRILADDFTVTDFIEFIEKVRDIYTSFGMVAAVGLPLFETLVPVLPLFLMLAFNILSYGIFVGYLFTYIGTSIGTIIIFFIMRYLSSNKLGEKRKNLPKVQAYMNWIENTHPILHIIVLMIPFSPAYLINYSMGLSKMKFSTFLIITLVSRAIMLIGCIPFGMTLITLYESGEFGGVQVMWLIIMGVVILLGVVFGQIANNKIKSSKTI